ncbi:hypothetical protein TSAR_012585 [Trichomalopsis sarcophagae]|uniref:Phosphatidylethanolamine-binding protein n=1 Tax=Trichomalopsis sarcophagae TaxID=543379 RepID=A0A232F8P2_9HYME|nr:hypothetical protein TSAR_012585 [Trichomalopsis sarcophagae]
MRLLVASLLLITAYAFAADIPTEFATACIVPDVLPKAPNELLTVTFKDSNDKDKDMQFGDELTPTLVKDPPAMSWFSEDSAYYTVAMVDPDAPSRDDPKLREMLHWLVCNIPGGDLSKGDVIVEYVGSAPGKDTGLHRYVLLAYKQPEKLTIEEAHISNHEHTGRPAFSIKNFAAKYKMGDPLAGNMYLAQYDEYSDIIRKQLGET